LFNNEVLPEPRTPNPERKTQNAEPCFIEAITARGARCDVRKKLFSSFSFLVEQVKKEGTSSGSVTVTTLVLQSPYRSMVPGHFGDVTGEEVRPTVLYPV
jgi:hypothetical protein